MCLVSLSTGWRFGDKPVADSQRLVQDCGGILGLGTMKRLVIAAATSILLLSGCKEDPEQAANKLFVETSGLWTQYQAFPDYDSTSYQARLDLLVQARDNLERIIQEYAESSLAVELAATGSVRNLDKQYIDQSIAIVEQSIPAYALMAATRPLWEQYQELPERDPTHYVTRLKLLSEIVPNVEKLNSDYPLSYEAQASDIDDVSAKQEIERITQSIPASALLAATKPLWQQYQELPENDPTQYETRLKLLSEIVLNLEKVNKDYPLSYEAQEPSINRVKAQQEIERIKQEMQCAKDFAACAIAIALEAVNEIIDKSEHTSALAKIATAQAANGDEDGAQSTIATALGSAVGAEAIVIVSEAQIDIGLTANAKASISKASKMAMGIQYDPPRVLALAKIATAQAAAGDQEGAKSTIATALATASSIPFGLPKVAALSEVAIAMVSTGAIDEASTTISMAQETLANIQSEVARTDAMVLVLRAQLLSGDAFDAQSALSETLRYIDGLKVESRRSEALAMVAILQAKAGDTVGALDTSSKMRHYLSSRPKVLAAVAVAQAEGGEVASALSMVEDIPNPMLRDEAHAAVAGALAAKGDIAAGFELAEGIKGKTHRTEAFVSIARALTKGK